MLDLILLTKDQFVGTTDQWHQESWYYLMKVKPEIGIDCYCGSNVNFNGFIGWGVVFRNLNNKQVEEIAERVICNIDRIVSWELWCCQEKKCIKRRGKI